jgi:universal stress protein E
MKIPKRILVVISGRHAEHTALQRALKFAEFDDIHIYLFISFYLRTSDGINGCVVH